MTADTVTDITEDAAVDFEELVAIIIAEEADLKVLLKDQKDRFLQRLHFDFVKEEAVNVAVANVRAEVAIAANFVICAVRRSWEYCRHQRYHQLRAELDVTATTATLVVAIIIAREEVELDRCRKCPANRRQRPCSANLGSASHCSSGSRGWVCRTCRSQSS